MYNVKQCQLLPILAKKMHQEKVQQEKLKAVKAHLNFEEISQYVESGTPSRSRDIKKRLGPKAVRSVSGCPEPRRGRSESPRKRDPERKMMFKRLENGVFRRRGDKEKGMSAYSNYSRRRSHYNSRRDTESYYQSSCLRGTELLFKRNHNRRTSSTKGGKLSESKDSAGLLFAQSFKTLFEGKLSANLTEDDFKFYFEKFGRITDVVVMHDNVTHRPRGFGSSLSKPRIRSKTPCKRTSMNCVVNLWKLNGRFLKLCADPRIHWLSPYGMFTGGYPVSGYGLGPVSPRVPWGPLPMPVYPAYLNGGHGLMGMAANGYNGIVGPIPNGIPSQLGGVVVDNNSTTTDGC
ncbi:reverse transcriptase domain-containing protein [Tanacetum coccineum]